MKRVLDLGLIFITSPLWLPILALTAMAVFVSMGRPVIYRDERAGIGGRSFTLVKFRTMRIGDGTDGERLTRFGRFIRATSLDELPELWNVIRGEMSLVGPRPLPVRYLPRYSQVEMRRHEVLPGITGLAQVNGRNSLDWPEKFKFDVYYVDHHSFVFDLKIIAMTVAQLFIPRGINHVGTATMPEFRGDSSLSVVSENDK